MKHLELFKQGFDSTLAEKVKVENWPFVGYDQVGDEVVYTEIPEPTIPDNEVWYTTTDGELANICLGERFGGSMAHYPDYSSHKKANGYNKVTFISPVESIDEYDMLWTESERGSESMTGFFGGSVAFYLYPNRELASEHPSTVTTVTIPACVKTVESGAFINCPNLEFITYKGTKEQWASVYKNYINIDHPSSSFYPKNIIVHCTDGDVTL